MFLVFVFTVGRTIIYTFLATGNVFRLGTLGRIETPIKGCKATFVSGRFSSCIVDHNTGIVRLNRRRRRLNRYRITKVTKLTTIVQVTTMCGYSKSQNFVKVIVLVFPFGFGNSFLRPYIFKIHNMVKENKKFDTQKGLATSLHRLMRMVLKEKNPESFNEIMASEKVNTVIDRAINDIVEKRVGKSSGDHSIHQLQIFIH